jgi:hypothetical protein
MRAIAAIRPALFVLGVLCAVLPLPVFGLSILLSNTNRFQRHLPSIYTTALWLIVTPFLGALLSCFGRGRPRIVFVCISLLETLLFFLSQMAL